MILIQWNLYTEYRTSTVQIWFLKNLHKTNTVGSELLFSFFFLATFLIVLVISIWSGVTSVECLNRNWVNGSLLFWFVWKKQIHFITVCNYGSTNHITVFYKGKFKVTECRHLVVLKITKKKSKNSVIKAEQLFWKMVFYFITIRRVWKALSQRYRRFHLLSHRNHINRW